ncbi:MAG: hypothetical protein ACFB20_12610 [Opitutales bacterium]
MAKSKKKRAHNRPAKRPAQASATATNPARAGTGAPALPKSARQTATAAKKESQALDVQGLLVSVAFFFLLVFTIFPSGQITYFTKFSKTFYAGGFINLILILTAGWLVWKKGPIKVNWGIWIFGAYTLYLSVVSLFYSGYYTEYYIAKHLAFLNIMLLAENFLSRKSLSTLALALGLALASLALFYAAGLAGFFDGDGGNRGLIFKSLHFGIDDDGKGGNERFFGARQLELTFGNPNMFGSFLALLTPVVITGIFVQRGWFGRILLTLVAASMLVMAFHSDSRNAIASVSGLGLVSVIVAGALLCCKQSERVLVPMIAFVVFGGLFGASIIMSDIFGAKPYLPLRDTAVVLLAIGGVLLLILIGLFAQKRLLYIGMVAGYLAFFAYCFEFEKTDFAQGKFDDTGGGASDGGRTFAYSAAIDLATEDFASITFGRGPGSLYANIFSFDTGKYNYTGANKSYLFAHQENLEIFLQGGVVGSAIHYGLAILTIGICLLAALERKRSIQERTFAAGLMLSICAFYFFGFFSLAVRYSATEFPYHLILALAWAFYAPRPPRVFPAWAWLLTIPFAVYSTTTIARTYYSDNFLVKAITGTNARTLDADQAQRMLQRSVEIFPQNIHAKTQIFLNNYNRAGGPNMDVLDEVFVSINGQIPNFKEISFFYGRACFLNGRVDEAIKHTRIYVDANRWATLARACLAYYYWADGQDQAAIQQAEEILLAGLDDLRLQGARLPSEPTVESQRQRFQTVPIALTHRVETVDGNRLLRIQLDEPFKQLTYDLPAGEITFDLDGFGQRLRNLLRLQASQVQGAADQRLNQGLNLIMLQARDAFDRQMGLPLPRSISSQLRQRTAASPRPQQ